MERIRKELFNEIDRGVISEESQSEEAEDLRFFQEVNVQCVLDRTCSTTSRAA